MPTGPDDAEAADAAVRLAEADPGRAAALARDLVDRARARRDPAVGSVAARALGVAALQRGDTAAAVRHLRAAAALGGRAGSPGLDAQARIRLAFALSVRGRPAAALTMLDDVLAAPLEPGARARAVAQRGVVLNQVGRLDEALACYRAAVPGLRRAGDRLWLQRVLGNRGVLHGYRHEFAAAEADLREAGDLCRALDLDLSLAYVQQNLGWLAALRGDVPLALDRLHRAEQRFTALGADLGELLADRAQLLLSVWLVSEAREAAEQAVALFEREHRGIALPEVRLLLAQATALDGHPDVALAQARRAVVEFRRQDRPAWAALARFLVLRAQPDGGGATVGQLVRAADELDATGWPTAAVDARLRAGRLALARGRPRTAREQLALAGRGRRRGPATWRARAWHAEALRRLADGDRRGARAALRRGLALLDEHRATLGATDLRAYASGHRTELAAAGLAMALEDGRPDRVLAWAEEGRASALLLRPVRPPDDPALAARLAELRAAVRAVADARSAGRSPARPLARQVELERAVRDHCRRHGAGPRGPAARPVPLRRLAGALGRAALVEFVAAGPALAAVTVVDGRAVLHDLGPVAAVRDLVDRVPFALHRLARRRVSPASRDAALALLRRAAARLDELLLRPLDQVTADRPLVLVPTGPLQSLPWSVLPSCRGRPVTVAPSAALWRTAADAVPRERGRVAVAAGPGLPGARAEAEAVAAIHTVPALVGEAATVSALVTSLDGAGLAHLAAHGHVHRQPLFTSIRLADGPLVVYDLERLERAPRVVVLATCDSGRAVVCAGDELLGLTATLLSSGTASVIASVLPVPDAETAPLMVAFHRALAAGRSGAEALALAQEAVPRDEPAALAAAAGFVCVGADPPPPTAGSSR